MNAWKRILISIIIFVLSCMALTGCISSLDWCLNYDDTVTEGNWEGALDRKHGRAFAIAYYWDGSDEGRRIEATTLEDCRVIKYGGYKGRGLPCPFRVEYKDGNISPEEIPEGADVEDVILTVVINPEISKLYFEEDMDFYFARENDDGTRSFYHAVIELELDKENRTYEIQDGLLYEKNESEPLLKWKAEYSQGGF